MAKHFNADFYITCATVIPVLFLGLVVQGGTYEDMLRAALEAAHRQPGRIREAAAPQLLPTVAYLSLMAGLLGEVFALLALFHQSDTSTDRAVILGLTTFLLVVVASGPAWRLMSVQNTIDRLEREHAGLERQEHPVPSPRHKA